MVAVCVSPTDLRPEVDPLTGSVAIDPRRADLPAADAAAVEYGLRMAEEWDGWVLVVCHGSAAADGVLRDVMAIGAEVIRTDTRPCEFDGRAGPQPVAPSDLAGGGAAVAGALAEVIRSQGRPAIVVCGDRSGGTGVGAVPAFLAAELGVGQALGLVSVTIEGPGHLTVERRLDGGWREQIRISGPAVLSVEGAGVRLRRADLGAALAAAQTPVQVVSGSPAGSRQVLTASSAQPYRPRPRAVPPPEGDAHERLLALTGALSTREPPRVVGPLPAAEAADELLGYLTRRGYRD